MRISYKLLHTRNFKIHKRNVGEICLIEGEAIKLVFYF